jgi:UDP-glucuronate 4-epimerase
VIEENLKKKARIKFCDPQPGDAEMTYADIQKAEKLLNFAPSTALEDGVRNFVSWYRDIKEDLC